MSFKNIKGQDRQINILANAIKRGTVSHAYLFTGISGIGKGITAIAMAKALNCKAENGDFCGCCISCKKIEHSNHPDIFWIEPEGDYIKIDQIRRMQERIKYTLYEGKQKVVIIDKVERMNLQSSNCLLKTLEEPPPHTILILLTSTPYQVISTIRSRCQRVMFQPLSVELILELMIEKHGGEESAELELIASLAGGSLGRAMQWMEGGVLQERKELLERINLLNKGCVTEILDLAELLSKDKETILEKLDFFRLWFRDLLTFKETDRLNYLINGDLKNEVRSIAGRLSHSNLFYKFQIVNEAQLAINNNVNPKLSIETMLLRLCQ
jgi:DNA polymerase-3 subunit delta'